MNTPLVFKFGGASVRDAASVRNVATIVQRFQDRPLVVVVSAMGKTTNALEEVVQHWLREEWDRMKETIQSIWDAHLGIVQELFGTPPADLLEQMQRWKDELLQDLKAEDRPYGAQYDAVVHKGELLSTAIVAAYLNLETPAQWLDTRRLVHTNDQHRRATVLWDATERAIVNAVSEPVVYVVQGFIGSAPNGLTTTLGREGSDYTGAVFAYCLGANSLTIWKDVPGMLNADPKVFPSPTLLRRLPFDEAIELAFYGASIIHPKTIQPLQKRGVPLHVKSFLHPELDGTVIEQCDAPEPQVPNYIQKSNQALLQVSMRDLAFIAEHHRGMRYERFAQAGVVGNLMQNKATKAQFAVNNDPAVLPHLVQELEQDYDVQLEPQLQLLTVRHYEADDLGNLVQGKRILLEQRTPNTLQFVYKDLT